MFCVGYKLNSVFILSKNSILLFVFIISKKVNVVSATVEVFVFIIKTNIPVKSAEAEVFAFTTKTSSTVRPAEVQNYVVQDGARKQ